MRKQLTTLALVTLTGLAQAGPITLPNTLSNNTPANADEVQANFDELLAESNENDGRLQAIEEVIEFSLDTGNTVLGDGLKNVIIGASPSINGQRNTAVGSSALMANTTGQSNTAIGFDALKQNIEGSLNTAVGLAALTSNSNGNFNIAIGNSSMLSNTSGYENTAIGVSSLRDNTERWGNPVF
ncbi:hypothetical protein N9H37_02425 [Congregibacter sp.]|nr:hypothetical protein [Congregibacter sp.]MDA8962189.1 hypothetical protein [Congregibacter sp.]